MMIFGTFEIIGRKPLFFFLNFLPLIVGAKIKSFLILENNSRKLHYCIFSYLEHWKA